MPPAWIRSMQTIALTPKAFTSEEEMRGLCQRWADRCGQWFRRKRVWPCGEVANSSRPLQVAAGRTNTDAVHLEGTLCPHHLS
jgi:hypothetical protein